MDNLDIIDIVKRENGIDEDFYGDYFVDCMEELPSIEERFNKYMEIVQVLKYCDDNDLVTPEKHLENMKNAIELLDGLIDNYCYSKEEDEYLLNKIIEENVFKDLLSCKHEDGKMASELVESFYNKNFSKIFTEYIKSYSANLEKEQLENDEGVIASLITYKDEQGEIKYNVDFVNTIGRKYSQTSNEIIPTELLIALRTYKGEDGKLYQGELEIPKDRFPQKTIEEIENSKEHSIVPVFIRIKDVSSLPVEKIEKLINKGVNIEGIIIESSLIPNNEKNKGVLYGYNSYDIETYKKCRMKIDQYISEANIDYENLKGTPNIDKIVFGKIIRMLSDISYDYSAVDAEGTKCYTARNLVGGLLQGNCVCAGYAEIVRNIFSCYGIETETIREERKTEEHSAHAWNQIKLDGQWYNMDLTQAAGTINEFSFYGCSYLLQSDKIWQIKLDYNVEQPTHECFESIPFHELHTYIFGAPEQIAELPVRGNYSEVCSSKTTENIINSLISSVKSTEIHESKQIVLESVSEKSPKQEELQK